MKCTTKPLKPFLRWAGGKSWLTSFVFSIIEKIAINHYYEPFLGGGAVFFALQPECAFLSDLNEELIRTYMTIREYPDEVITKLKSFTNDSDCYYRIRKTMSNDVVYMCARFIFLNQTSYNGLYRVNIKGHYNVPFGHRDIDFVKEDHLREISGVLRRADFQSGDFESCLGNIQEKDLVFLDPPYTVSHNHNGFIKYNQNLFSMGDQHRLSSFIDQIKSRGAYYILTNAANERIREIFDKNDIVHTLSRHNTIGGRQAKRGHVEECVFTNIRSEV